MTRRSKVVIVGGGFGGLRAVKALRGAPVDILLVDRRNHHLFQPLLYQVATAALSPADIASPIRGILRRQENVDVILGEVVDIRPDEREIELADGTRLPYDHLIVATGAVDQYFGHGDWPHLAPGLKSIEDATVIRRRFLLSFEAAERETDPAARRALLTTVVIGAGPTGVEMAGAMAEMARHSIVRDFRSIDPSSARVLLVEGGDRVLPAYHPRLSERAERALVRRGVEVRKGAIVSRITSGAIFIGEERIPTRNVVWAAGVAASPIGSRLGAELDRMGRVLVAPDLSLPGHPEIFVVGDLARVESRAGEPLPGLAPVAMQQGRTAGENIRAQVEGRPTRPFRYRDRGSMATIGRGAAIADIRGFRLSGLLAWLAWIFVHIFFLIGFRNRIAVMLQWAWAYLTWQRGARLITGPIGERLAPSDQPLGETGARLSPEVEDALEVTAHMPPRQPEEQKGWMSGDADQTGGR
jgi:NADH:ubiquinone reductase (H+-translocating)